jgi:AbiV family abortive infection protein
VSEYPDSIAIIAENAERLLTHAKLLAQSGSYRSAISLAVLSMEESGKACLALWSKAGKKTEVEELKLGHINKQRIYAAHRMLKAVKAVGLVVRKEDLPSGLARPMRLRGT